VAYAEKRGKGWRARYQRPDGTLGSEPGFPTRTAAERYGNDQEAAIRAGTWIDPKLGETPLADWWAQWFPVQDFKPGTAKAYGQQWRKHIEPRWGSTPLAAIRGIKIEEWLKALRDETGLSASTLNIITSALRGCLESAVFNEMIGRSPMPPKGKAGKRKAVDAEARPGIVVPLPAIEQILARLGSDADRLIVLVALFTGMRWSEIAAMRVRDLHLAASDDGAPASGYYRIDPKVGALHADEHARPYFGSPKSGSATILAPGYKRGRIIDLPAFLVLMLLAYLEALPATKEDLLFPNRSGDPRRYDWWNAGHWRPVCDGRAASVSPKGLSVRDAQPAIWPGLHFHDLKHTHKAILNDLRVHPVMQDYRLGHVTPGAPGIYSHPTAQMRAELVEGLQRFWEGWLAAGFASAWADWRHPRSTPKALPRTPQNALGGNVLF
jgi:integrase